MGDARAFTMSGHLVCHGLTPYWNLDVSSTC